MTYIAIACCVLGAAWLVIGIREMRGETFAISGLHFWIAALAVAS